MKIFLLTFLSTFFLCQGAVFGQQEITWKTLTDVTFTEEYSDEFASYLSIPDFGPSVKSLDGKEVQISGYVIPLDVEMNQYVLSANPFASCFFCGNAGPESVMDIILTQKDRFRTDQFLTFKGVLRLNVRDIYHLNYILEEAEVVE